MLHIFKSTNEYDSLCVPTKRNARKASRGLRWCFEGFGGLPACLSLVEISCLHCNFFFQGTGARCTFCYAWCQRKSVNFTNKINNLNKIFANWDKPFAIFSNLEHACSNISPGRKSGHGTTRKVAGLQTMHSQPKQFSTAASLESLLHHLPCVDRMSLWNKPRDLLMEVENEATNIFEKFQYSFI